MKDKHKYSIISTIIALAFAITVVLIFNIELSFKIISIFALTWVICSMPKYNIKLSEKILFSILIVLVLSLLLDPLSPEKEILSIH